MLLGKISFSKKGRIGGEYVRRTEKTKRKKRREQKKNRNLGRYILTKKTNQIICDKDAASSKVRAPKKRESPFGFAAHKSEDVYILPFRHSSFAKDPTISTLSISIRGNIIGIFWRWQL